MPIAGPQLLIAVHVEPGFCRNREILFESDHSEGVTDAVPTILDFADDMDVPFTFALTPFALQVSDVDFHGHSVGLHLHPRDAVLRDLCGQDLDLTSDCLADYPRGDQEKLLDASLGMFEAVLGTRPRTFVAGRWSENEDTLDLLIHNGFGWDGSPLPGHKSHCAEWSRVPRLAQPYRPSPVDRQARGDLELVYMPVFQGLWNHYFTPEVIHDLGPSYFRGALMEAQVGGADLVHVYFHSPMALDPYFLDTFREVMVYAIDGLNLTTVTPEAVTASRERIAKPFPPAYLANLSWKVLRSFVGRSEVGRSLMRESTDKEVSRGS